MHFWVLTPVYRSRLTPQTCSTLASSWYDNQASQSWELLKDEGFRSIHCIVSRLSLLPVFSHAEIRLNSAVVLTQCQPNPAPFNFFFKLLFCKFSLEGFFGLLLHLVAETEQPERLLTHQKSNQKEGKLKLEVGVWLCWTNETSGLADVANCF